MTDDRAFLELISAIQIHRDIHGAQKTIEVLTQELERERALQRIMEARQAQGGCQCRPERLVPRKAGMGGSE